MGEAPHLIPSERLELIHAARNALDKAGLTQTPLIVGTGTGSTRETIHLTEAAAAAGADYAIVICNGYFAGVLAGNTVALKAYWKEIAQKSPIPVMMYNCAFLFSRDHSNLTIFPMEDPGATGGIDLDSDLITELAVECPNLCGVKLTCGTLLDIRFVADQELNS